ncbi:MAG: hypothetical protein CMF59_12620 [Leptospiraceae bacterium]|nr:hypothetical protein [Leptospiraceae bacterium]
MGWGQWRNGTRRTQTELGARVISAAGAAGSVIGITWGVRFEPSLGQRRMPQRNLRECHADVKRPLAPEVKRGW